MNKCPSRFDVNNVVAILSGPRTGSSFLFRNLIQTGCFISPEGEETPFYKSAGLGLYNGPHFNDQLNSDVSESTLDSVGSLLLANSGLREKKATDIEHFARQIYTRLSFQQPEIQAVNSFGKIESFINEKLHLADNSGCDWKEFYLNLIDSINSNFSLKLAKSHLEINSTDLLDKLHLIEEPPYIHPTPSQKSDLHSLNQFPLLLKTSTNVYRTDFLRKLFPNAQFRWIILTRNPAASVNGLIEGWLSNGFHSHDVSPEISLNIKGYSDVKKFGHNYWKFDMPPGWKEYTDKDLIDVCSFQWVASHQKIIDFVKSTKDPYMFLKYEALIKQNDLEKIIHFCGTYLQTENLLDREKNVLAVTPPQAGKWKKRESEIRQIFTIHKNIAPLAEQFGYKFEQMDFWP